MAEPKDSLETVFGRRRQERRTTSPVRFILFNLLIGVACLGGLYSFSRIRRGDKGLFPPEFTNADPELIWSVLPASPPAHLVWVPCYEKLQCARMVVPLDYADPDGPSGTIALAKVPSKVPKSDKRYRGPILFNPGGPGGSGVDTIVSRGGLFQTILGDDYDLIGFDPRGVGRTIPQVKIFPDEAEGARWRLAASLLPLPNATSDAVARRYAGTVIYGKLAEERTMDASPYVSTALVCRDMLTMMRAHGREKIQYWGFSYGTVLGATFAAMFPEHVERLIIDGVEDSIDYYAALWSNNLVDTDKGLDIFFEACADAGPELCALHDSSAAKVKERYRAVLDTLKRHPVAVPAPSSLSGSTAADYGIIDYALALQVVFEFLYKPYYSDSRPVNAPRLASALAALETGDGLPMWELQKNNTAVFECKCGSIPSSYKTPDATAAISCSDGDVVEDSVEGLQASYDRMAGDSEFANLWDGHMRCAGWKIRSVERFHGPFSGDTSYPLLLIGNTADPVTPVRNAHFMSKGYNGSVVLTQNSAGHCSLAASSSCTAKAVRAYFREGKLPEPGTVCEIESKMFTEANSEALSMQDYLTSEDIAAIDAWRALSAKFETPLFGM